MDYSNISTIAFPWVVVYAEGFNKKEMYQFKKLN